MNTESLFLLKHLIKTFKLVWLGDLNKYFCVDQRGVWFSHNTESAVIHYTKEQFESAVAELADEESNWFDYDTNRPKYHPPLDTSIYLVNKGEIPERSQNAKCLCTVIGYGINNTLLIDTSYGIRVLGKDSEILPEDWYRPAFAIMYIKNIGINYDQATDAEKAHLIRLYQAKALKGQ